MKDKEYKRAWLELKEEMLFQYPIILHMTKMADGKEDESSLFQLGEHLKRMDEFDGTNDFKNYQVIWSVVVMSDVYIILYTHRNYIDGDSSWVEEFYFTDKTKSSNIWKITVMYMNKMIRTLSYGLRLKSYYLTNRRNNK